MSGCYGEAVWRVHEVVLRVWKSSLENLGRLSEGYEEFDRCSDAV